MTPLLELMARASHASCDDVKTRVIHDWFTVEGHAKNIIAALKAADDAGYVLVPKEPTETMKGAGYAAVDENTDREGEPDINAGKAVWVAMLAARP